MSIEVMDGGLIYLREMSFGSDHGVYARLSRREDDDTHPWESQGWTKKPDWQSMERVRRIVAMKQAEGWTVQWNPVFAPGLNEFMIKGEF